jgi:hypothetical protein
MRTPPTMSLVPGTRAVTVPRPRVGPLGRSAEPSSLGRAHLRDAHGGGRAAIQIAQLGRHTQRDGQAVPRAQLQRGEAFAREAHAAVVDAHRAAIGGRSQQRHGAGPRAVELERAIEQRDGRKLRGGGGVGERRRAAHEAQRGVARAEHEGRARSQLDAQGADLEAHTSAPGGLDAGAFFEGCRRREGHAAGGVAVTREGTCGGGAQGGVEGGGLGGSRVGGGRAGGEGRRERTKLRQRREGSGRSQGGLPRSGVGVSARETKRVTEQH